MSDDEVRQWRASVGKIASTCPNVVCKVGGAQMKVNGFGFEHRDIPVGSGELAV